MFFISSFSFGQKPPVAKWDIRIEKIHHYFLLNKKGDLTKRIKNRKNRPYLICYLDTSGNVIEKAGYGKQHDKNLRLLDFVAVNTYKQGKLVETIEYHTDYKKNITPEYNTKYSYNTADQLVKKVVFYYGLDSVLMQFDYKYDHLNNKIRSESGNDISCYSYDSASRITALQQVFDNKLRWECRYTYTDTTRVGDFRSYHHEIYTKQEIETYNNKMLVQVEEKYTSGGGGTEIRKNYYNNAGLVKRIEFHKSTSSDGHFDFVSFINIKIRIKYRLSKELVMKINELIVDDY